MKLTAEVIAGVYSALRQCQPFKRWHMPAAEEISFAVTKHKDREGHYTRYVGTDQHFICVSESRICHFDSLCIVVSHEMLHLLQAIMKTETRAQHNADFRRRAALVCKTLGFDPHIFC